MEHEPGKDLPKPKRPRITPSLTKPLIPDPKVYVQNLASAHTILTNSINVPFRFEIWFEKHLHDRQLHGDEKGERKGITDEDILPLLEQSLPHIVFYSLNVSSFSALERDKRVCIKNNPVDGSEALNIICQIHNKDFDRNVYEVTLITAMCTHDFKVKDNQYVIELQNESYSVLKRFNRGNFLEVCTN